jgi:osmotically-inducible protein OsmY
MSPAAQVPFGLVTGFIVGRIASRLGAVGRGSSQEVPVSLTTGDSTMNQISKYLSAVFLAVTLVTAVGCSSTSKQEGTGEYVDDTVITSKVKTAVFNEPMLKSAEINVETFKGVVQLSGFVSSQAAANKATEVARSVGGVKSVKNDMRIK